MANEFELSPKELKRQADALLAAADAAEKAAEREPAESLPKVHRKKGEETAQEAPGRHDGRGGPEGRHPPGWNDKGRWLRCPQPPG